MRSRQRMAGAVCALVVAAFSGASFGAQASNRTGGPTEGIKVHGHWTIDIKSADGTLIERHEFENALRPDGAMLLARVLGRLGAPGEWVVFLWSPGATPNCSPNIIPCSLSESSTSAPLAVSVNFDTLVLTGSFTSPDARSFTTASTQSGECPLNSAGCSSARRSFTSKDFPPISVQAGQIVQVTVAISFS
jgi:hypothetical protein